MLTLHARGEEAGLESWCTTASSEGGADDRSEAGHVG